MSRPSSLEPLEARCTPALINPLGDIVAAPGHDGGATVELGQMLDPFALYAGHTLVTFTLNLDTDPTTPGIQPAVITLELFDDEAPLTVANFLRYAIDTANASAFANDFVGTYFHRSETNFVVQGGGFIANDTLTEHIETFAPVHNEFSSSRSNLRGTIAMAKVGAGDGGGPHSATSEWFVNLGNNSANLDAQNGGFTVFGQVIEGMEHFDQIATLTKASFGGLSIPVQNYTSGKPTQDQIIRVTEIEVATPQAGNTAGQTFDIEITPVSGDADLLTPLLDGSSLRLDYADGKSGVADVTVEVTLNGETFTDTFRVTVQPNLISTINNSSLTRIVVPGDVVKPSVTLTNNGGADFTGAVNVKFYLSPQTATDPEAVIRDADDILIGSFNNVPVNIASDGTVTLSDQFTLQAHLDESDGIYRLLTEVTPASGPAELFSDDNVDINNTGTYYANQFGFINIAGVGSRVAKLVYAEADGNQVTLSITGAGVGRASANEGGVNVIVAGTNAASIVNLGATVSSTDKTAARAELHHIDIVNALGTLNFAQADIDGYITISNGVKVAKFGNVEGNERTMILGALGALNKTPAKLTFGNVTDLNLESDQPIAAINAASWTNTDNSERNRILTPTLTRLNVAGDFETDVDIFRSTALSAFTVKGFLRDATITTPGNVGTVSLGGMIDSNFFVGTDARPDSLDDFTTKRTISKFSILGVAGASTGLFDNSQVSASTIAAIVVKGIAGANAGAPFGFVADKVLSYSVNGKAPLLNLTAPGVFGEDGDYSVTVL